MNHFEAPIAQPPQNAGILGEVITDPTVLEMIAAARATDTTTFDTLRGEYLAARGDVSTVEGTPENAFAPKG